jgi:argininosuccinate lyase
LFDTVDTLLNCIDIYIRMLPEISVKRERMMQAASTGFLNATDMADYLVTRGMPFREAHACVGKAVSYALGKGQELHELSIDELKIFSGLVNTDIYDYLSIDSMINRRVSHGGTARANIERAIASALKAIEAESDL